MSKGDSKKRRQKKNRSLTAKRQADAKLGKTIRNLPDVDKNIDKEVDSCLDRLEKVEKAIETRKSEKVTPKSNELPEGVEPCTPRKSKESETKSLGPYTFSKCGKYLS